MALPILDTMVKVTSTTRDRLAKYKYNNGLPRMNEAIEKLLDEVGVEVNEQSQENQTQPA